MRARQAKDKTTNTSSKNRMGLSSVSGPIGDWRSSGLTRDQAISSLRTFKDAQNYDPDLLELRAKLGDKNEILPLTNIRDGSDFSSIKKTLSSLARLALGHASTDLIFGKNGFEVCEKSFMSISETGQSQVHYAYRDLREKDLIGCTFRAQEILQILKESNLQPSPRRHLVTE